MPTKIESKPSDSTFEPIDGDIYVRLRSKRLRWRGIVMMALAALAAGSGILTMYAQSGSVESGRRYTKGTTECPGMTPAQKAASLLLKH